MVKFKRDKLTPKKQTFHTFNDHKQVKPLSQQQYLETVRCLVESKASLDLTL